jgi:hypothetical protein
MSDSFNSAYLATRKDRHKTELDALLAADEKYLQAQQPKAPQGAPAAPSQAPKKDTSPGVMQEAKRAVVGGVQDAVYNVTHMADEFSGWLNENFLNLRAQTPTRFVQAGTKEAKRVAEQTSLAGIVSGKRWDATKVTQPETTAGKVARGLVSFGTGFAATAALTGGVGGGVMANMGRGAVTDFAVNDPSEGNLSNLIMEVTKDDPFMGQEVFKMLSTDPNDNAAWNRSKNTLEGAGLGAAAEGLVKAVRWGVGKARGAGKDPVEVLAQPKAPEEDLTAMAVDTSKAPDLSLAEQIELVTGAKRNGPSKFQKALDMKAALKDADVAAQPKGLELADGPLPTSRAEGNPDQFLKGGKEVKLEDPDAIPFEKGVSTTDTPSFPDAWKLVEEDPAPRKLFLDPEDGSVVLAKEAATPQQLDLDLALPEVLKKTDHTPDERAMLESYKELQEKALKEAPTEPASASKGAAEGADLDERIAKAQARVDALTDQGRDTASAQKVLDNLLKKKDGGLFDHATKLTGRQADKLDTAGDPLVDAIAANNEKLLRAVGKQQGGFVSPSLLANLVSTQAGGVVGFLSAEDDATFAERMSLAGIGMLAGFGIKVGASKVLKGHERAVIDAPHPEVVRMSRPEVANVAPLVTVKKAPVITGANVSTLVKAAQEGGMESLVKAVKESDFNFSHIDTADDVKETIDAFSAVFEKETSLAKHGTQSFADMKELAEELGAGTESLKDLYKGTNNLAGRVLAHRALLAASAEKVTGLAKLAQTGDADGILALRKHVALHAAIQAQMKGVQTEIARALGQFRITATSVDLAVNERHQLIQAMGGHDANILFARQLSEITDPKKLNAVIRKSWQARTKDALYEAWVNGLLSGPVTHAVNMVSNGIVAIASPAERLVAGMWGKVLRSGDEGIQLGEAKAQLFGMAEGFTDAIRITAHGMGALKRAGGDVLQGNFQGARETIEDASGEFGNAWKAAATDMPVLDNAAYGTREYDLQGGAISASAMSIDPKTALGMTADGLGALIRTPGRLLTTSDEIFKTIHYRGELKAQAYRQATAEGLHGDALFKRVAELVEDPTPEVAGLALDAARKGTFTAPLGDIGQTASELIRKTPGGRWLVPFVRTPTNIMKFVGVRTPGLNLLAKSVREDFAAGGARRDMMLARTTMGGAMYAAAGYMAAQGLITGGGEKINTAERLSGWQPYSVKVGAKYIAYNRMDPFGMFLGMAADVVDLSGNLDSSEVDELSAMAVLAVSRNLVSKSYASGVVQFIEAMSQPEARMEKYLQGLLGSTVPAVVNAVRREDDPLVREVWSFTDALRNRIPGLSKDLPPKRNVFGEPTSVIGGLGPDIVSPFRTTVESTDPLAQELARLNIDLRQPPKTLATASGAKGIDLSPEQYDKLVTTAGTLFKESLASRLDDPAYTTLTEGNPDYQDGKEKVIQNLHARAKFVATRMLLAEDAELRERWQAEKKNASAALSGNPILPF